MTVISLILIAIFLYILGNRKNQLVNAITLLLFFSINNINIGYFWVIGGLVISYTDLLTAFMFFICITIVMRNPEVDRKIFTPILLLIFVILVGIFRLQINPPTTEVVSYSGSWDSYFRGNTNMLQTVAYSKQSTLQFIRTLLFLFIISVIKSSITYDDWKIILHKLVVSTRCLLPIYIIEAVLMGLNSSAFYMIRNRFFGGYYMMAENRLSGLSTEPSYYAITIFLVVSINMLNDKVEEDYRKKPITILTCVIYVVLGVFSGAFSFLWTGILLVFLYFVKDNKMSSKKYGLVTALLMVIFTVQNNNLLSLIFGSNGQLFNERITNIFQSITEFNQTGVMQYSSEGTRMGSILMLLKAWSERPFFGIGIGTSFCFSGVFSIIATVGVLGLVLWYYIVFHAYPKGKTVFIVNLIFIMVFLPAGDFELFYGFNVILWAEISAMLFEFRNTIKEETHLL